MPTETKPFRWRERGQSFVYAFRGIGWLLGREHNAWIHMAAATLACILGGSLGISRVEWCLIVLAIFAVLAAEAFNTAVEKLADAAVPRQDRLAGLAKDLAAAGVLLTSIGAAVIGLLVFVPRIVALFLHKPS
jgi:diacylglycerol kinase (ATP)